MGSPMAPTEGRRRREKEKRGRVREERKK